VRAGAIIAALPALLLLAAASTPVPDVSHMSVLEGSAIIGRAEGGNVTALRNAPLLPGDTISTASGTLAEVQLAPGVALRLDGQTRAALTSLAFGRSELRLFKGTIAVSLTGGDAPQIDTPSIALRPDGPGRYRVSAGAGESVIVVHRGELRVITPNGTQFLGPGEQITIDGPATSPHLSYAVVPPNDAFDGFNETRDAARASIRDELAPYGRWIQIKGYGSAWSPREFAGWAPYHSGRWLWRRGIGWTWIPRESWGWRPFHYGTWMHDPTRGWCWIPPPSASAPWAASNAVFFAVVVNEHAQSLGWVPLAPRESYHATLNDYRNASAPGGITILPFPRFYSGDFSQPSFPTLSQLPGRIVLQAPVERSLISR
jgi:hypothetical protein